MTADPETDPKALIHEAYRIENITAAECRSIFLDWALSLPVDADTAGALKALIDRHAEKEPDHPMSGVLKEGLTRIAAPRRRGGWRSRPRN